MSNIVLGTALVLGAFSLMERNVATGAAGGLVVGIVGSVLTVKPEL